jgi:hypothetical protein
MYKLLWTINVGFDVADHLLIRFSAIFIYSGEEGGKMKQ